MKVCPVCKARCFDDMTVCYGCMHRFTVQPGEQAWSFRSQQATLGQTADQGGASEASLDGMGAVSSALPATVEEALSNCDSKSEGAPAGPVTAKGVSAGPVPTEGPATFGAKASTESLEQGGALGAPTSEDAAQRPVVPERREKPLRFGYADEGQQVMTVPALTVCNPASRGGAAALPEGGAGAEEDIMVLKIRIPRECRGISVAYE